MQDNAIQTKTFPSAEARPAPRSGVLAYPLDDDLVLCDEQSGEVFTLNPTAARIWTLCDGVKTIQVVARAIAEEFAIDDERACADVETLVADLLGADLVRLS